MEDLAPARADAGTETPAAPGGGEPWRDAPGSGRPPCMLDPADTDRLLQLLDLLEAVNNEQQFRDLLDGPMQGLLPHRRLLCGTSRVLAGAAGIAPRYLLLQRFPAAYLEPLSQPGGQLHCVLTERWLHTRQPVLADLRHDARSWPAGWVLNARRHGFVNFASHAFFEASGATFTHFCFADLPGRPAARHAQLLRLLVPHLHLALLRVAGIGAGLPASPQALHPHQLEILRWLHVGKTNWEISMILGMSVHNVKYHVAQLLVKLDAANRVHAVARARERGLLDERPAPVRTLPGMAAPFQN